MSVGAGGEGEGSWGGGWTNVGILGGKWAR